MTYGPFALVTESERLLAGGFPGVHSPAELSQGLASCIQAVIIDGALPEETRGALVAHCIRRGIPAFHWQTPPHLAEADAKTFLQLTLSFLRAQKERPLGADPAIDQETFERIELAVLLDIITTANSLLEPNDVMNAVMGRIHRLIPCGAWSVLILEDHPDPALCFAAAYGPNKEKLEGIKVPVGKGIAGWVAKHRKPIIVNDARKDPRFMAEVDRDTQFQTKNILCAPLVSRGRAIGVIEMLNHENGDGFTQQDLELVQTLVNPAAVAIENAYLFQKTQRLTIQDDLTKLFNARHLNHCLEVELKRAMRGRRPLSLIFLDLDGFKAVNDNFGHLLGSQALVDIGRIIAGCARETDIVGRYGGDEFVLILPETDTEGAVFLGERIRDGVAAYAINGMKVTASIGIATYPRHGQTKDVLFRQADHAMYRVKEKGKNGILIAHEV